MSKFTSGKNQKVAYFLRVFCVKNCSQEQWQPCSRSTQPRVPAFSIGTFYLDRGAIHTFMVQDKELVIIIAVKLKI